MDPNQVNQVIDKVAEKVGVAADKIIPMGAEVIRQYQFASIAAAITFGVLALITVISAWNFYKFCLKRESQAKQNQDKYSSDWLAAAIFIRHFGVGLVGLFIGLAGYQVVQACAPAYYCLKELIK